MGGMTKPLHIFKSGRRTAMSGLTLDFSESDLAASAAAYDPAKHEAPLVVGHPRHDAPAYGWVRSLAATEDGLHAEPHQVNADFAELVSAGSFKKISASFFLPDSPNNPVPGVYYLRHVGFLGALAPAVKGLKAVEFAEFAQNEEGVVEFADYGLDATAGLWRRMREWLLAQFGQAAADQVVPDWQIDALREAARADDTDDQLPRVAFADPVDPPPGAAPNTVPTTPKENLVSPEQKAALEQENARLKQELQAAQAATQAAARAQRHTEHVNYAEQLISEGRLAPKHKDTVVAFLDFADGEQADGQVLEFGEGEAKQPLADAFKSFLAEAPKVVEFGEVATNGRAAGDATGVAGTDHVDFGEADPERLKQHQAVLAHMAAHKVDYATAARAVIR